MEIIDPGKVTDLFYQTFFLSSFIICYTLQISSKHVTLREVMFYRIHFWLSTLVTFRNNLVTRKRMKFKGLYLILSNICPLSKPIFKYYRIKSNCQKHILQRILSLSLSYLPSLSNSCQSMSSLNELHPAILQTKEKIPFSL